MNKTGFKTPMLDGAPWLRLNDFMVLARRLKLKITRSYGKAGDITDSQKDKLFPFDEYPDCASCGCKDSKEILTAVDGNRVVECSSCGLWYTSPRIEEAAWTDWLLQDSSRNQEFTENRLIYGDPLARNIPLSFSFWWRITRYRNQRHVKKLIKMHGDKVESIHDVGCGVGFFLKSCEELGLRVSGNDLNGYAVGRMRDLFGFDVHVGQLKRLLDDGVLKLAQFDIVHMNDFIEHTYHPDEEIEIAYRLLRVGGLIYLRTFFVDSDKFRDLGKDWDMLMWNHAYHFSSESLSRLVENKGFKVKHIECHHNTGIIEIYGIKH